MSKGATVVLVVMLGTGCASQMARTPVQAMLLPPVDGKLALWIDRPAYFAVLGTGPERGTQVLYQQTALEAVPASGYVYVPGRAGAEPDADYEQVYLVASRSPIDLSAFPSATRDVDAMQRVLAGSEVVDGYQKDTVDRFECVENSFLADADYADGRYDPYHVYRLQLGLCSQLRRSNVASRPLNRTFFVPMPRIHPPGKGVPPRVPPVEIKGAERMARYLAAKEDSRALSQPASASTATWSRSGTQVVYTSHPAASATSTSSAPTAVSSAPFHTSGSSSTHH